MRPDRFDIHQHVTDQIIVAIESSRGEFKLPWHVPVSRFRPTNVASNKPYRGVNVLALWAAAEGASYSSGIWGTYRQWVEAGAQVRRGEKASYVVFYKEAARGDPNETNDTKGGKNGGRENYRWIARASAVFAAEQVEGFVQPAKPVADPVQAIDRADEFVTATGAQIVHDELRAFYRSRTDTIHIPTADLFIGSKTSTPTEAYYATLLHELTHWTAHETRCARPLGGRFGREAYAVEELIAELGSAFLCADLQIASAPRADHAHYIKDWLSVLKADKKAIFTAASQASKAVEFLKSLQPADEAGAGPTSPAAHALPMPSGRSHGAISSAGPARC